MAAERRRAKRVNVGFPVKVIGIDATGNRFEEMSRTTNISALAVRLPLKGSVRHHDTVTLTLPLPRDMRPEPTVAPAYTSKGVVSRIDYDRGQRGEKSVVVKFTR
ncbi:MAG: hypothetical protein AB1714_21280 [Acidobacteriota bacterium]